jgi:hypothetical protein
MNLLGVKLVEMDSLDFRSRSLRDSALATVILAARIRLISRILIYILYQELPCQARIVIKGTQD